LMVANGPTETADAALELMASGMGSHGPDLLYELLTVPRIGAYPRERAEALLKDPATRGLATTGLLMANDLRAAVGCARKDLFARAKVEGDGRSLPYLKPLLVTTGCDWHRRGDCFKCLTNRAELRATIATIEKRSAKR
jgi:hypothetical protein